ncbi:hypothetical protein [Sphingomonas sp.]|uniref:hypothetical protein n=1 Tax=Sphingomonas sp. TaxID=28214 RepID=UPI003B3B7E6A
MKISLGAKALPLGLALALAACGGGSQNSSDTANSTTDSANMVDPGLDNGTVTDNGGAMSGSDMNAGMSSDMNGAAMDGTGGNGADVAGNAGATTSTTGATGGTTPSPQ